MKEGSRMGIMMSNDKVPMPPTLKEILANRKSTDSKNVSISKHNYKEPQNPKSLYEGSVDNIPEEILNSRIVAWLRKDGIYIAE